MSPEREQPVKGSAKWKFPEGTRYFFAWRPSERELKALLALAERLMVQALPFGQKPWRFVRQEQLHLTLAFLPAGQESIEEGLRSLPDQLLSSCDPLGLSFSILSAFPSPDRARVLWLGISEGTSGLELASETLRTELRRVTALFDEKPFRPHLTLARARGRPSSVTPQEGASVCCVFDEIELVASIPGREGYQHRPLRRFPLGK